MIWWCWRRFGCKTVFLLNILWSLLDGGNWWRSSWKIVFPIFVETALLKGRLNQMMLRCRFLFVLLLLETNQPWNCRLFRHHVQLNNGTYRPYKNPNNLLLYINKSSNHPPQIINQLPKIINERLSRWIPPMKKSLIHLNINMKNTLETVDTPILN